CRLARMVAERRHGELLRAFGMQIAEQKWLLMLHNPLDQASRRGCLVDIAELPHALVDHQASRYQVGLALVDEAEEGVDWQELGEAAIHAVEDLLKVERRVDDMADLVDHRQLGQPLFALVE